MEPARGAEPAGNRAATRAVVFSMVALTVVPLAVVVSQLLACGSVTGCPGSEYAVAIAVPLALPVAVLSTVLAVRATRSAWRVVGVDAVGRGRATTATVCLGLLGLLVGVWLVLLAVNLSAA